MTGSGDADKVTAAGAGIVRVCVGRGAAVGNAPGVAVAGSTGVREGLDVGAELAQAARSKIQPNKR